jgi:GH25 family lysozyme M1 (1,4-beta-N-acetylmuramidase)
MKKFFLNLKFFFLICLCLLLSGCNGLSPIMPNVPSNSSECIIYNLPAYPVSVKVLEGNSSSFLIELKDVGSGYDIYDGIWKGWCADNNTSITLDKWCHGHVYCSYDPPCNLENIAWPKINWIINNKGLYNADYIQDCIWHFTNGISPNEWAEWAGFLAMNFCPNENQKYAAIIDIPGKQPTFIEVPIAQATQNSNNEVEVYGTVNKTLEVYKDLNSLNTPIGEKYWGSIGTIIDGPKEEDKSKWYKIKWDNDENVLDNDYYKPETGWSESKYIWEYDTNKRARGIDISHHNSIESDGYEKIHNSGREFAFVKGSEGQNTPLDTEKYLEGLKNAGIVVGVYHLGRPDLYPNGAYTEAEHFYKEAKNYIDKGYLRPALDLEQEGFDAFIGDGKHSVNELIMWINNWTKRVQDLSILTENEKPILYITKTIAGHLASSGDKSIKDYPLWIVDWSNDSETQGYSNADTWIWSFRQYAGDLYPEWAGRSRCPGFAVNAGVDLDIFNGSLEELKAEFLIN